jgi:hypothetical protein
MATTAKNKIINMTAAGDRYTGVVYVNAIQALASGDTSVVKIVDTDGEVVLHQQMDISNQRTFPPITFAKPQRFDCLTVDTWTDMARVTFYCDRIGDE